jgi:hypothetical protein
MLQKEYYRKETNQYFERVDYFVIANNVKYHGKQTSKEQTVVLCSLYD